MSDHPIPAPPPWNAPAHLWGLPYTNWKKRTGYDLHATLGECVYRFLNLPHYQQQNCQMACAAVRAGVWGPASIGVYVKENGPPPNLPPNADLKRLLGKPVYTPPPTADKPPPGHS